jgi:hypothetical protein
METKTISSHAHSKGVIAGSTSGDAIIINHSMPKFPNFDEEGNIELVYPSNALRNG